MFSLALEEVDLLTQASRARTDFAVSGAGLTVGVADTGLNMDHVDFAGRIVARRNFTLEDGGDPDIATDRNGHGTNVGGIIAADLGDHRGLAPGAGIVPLKVLDDSGSGSFAFLDNALQWVLDNAAAHGISCVCASLGDGGNYQDDAAANAHPVAQKLIALKAEKIAVCIAAGNDFFTHGSAQGMSFPAILRNCISVGAVYDAFEGPFSYNSGAVAHISAPDHITPFSQRLHADLSPHCSTDIFAPGAPVRSAGINGPNGESIQHGTSQATPVIAGLVLLMQEFHLRETATLPEVDQLVTWMQRGAVEIFDGDDENNNVTATNKTYLRANAVGALDAMRKDLTKSLFLTGSFPGQ